MYVADYKDMIDSIEYYGGFYVGRYELTGTKGNPMQKAGTVLNGNADGNNNTLGDNLDWYDFYNECQKFTKENVKSTMIWGTQWDSIMDWINSTAEQTGKYVDSSNKSTGWGNYKGVEIKDSEGNIINKENGNTKALQTGITEYTKVNNIYDLAGNYIEWTQEAYGEKYRSMCGSHFNDNDDNNWYAAKRGSGSATIDSNISTSRPTLYIKNN